MKNDDGNGGNGDNDLDDGDFNGILFPKFKEGKLYQNKD